MTNNVVNSGEGNNSKRGFLASLWSLLTILTAICFLAAFIFVVSTNNKYEDGDGNEQYYNRYNYNNDENKEGSQDEQEYEEWKRIAVTSRALTFSALWTGVLAVLLSVFGTVIIGYQSPFSGLYYTCCSSSVHRTTPLGIGSFIGALLMFANLTLVCSVLFGEFEIRDNGEDRGGGGGGGANNNDYHYYGQRKEYKSMAFSYMCIALTILYGGFAALTLSYANDVIEELAVEEDEEIMNNNAHGSNNIMMTSMNKYSHNAGYDSGYYIGERFDVVSHRPRSGFVSTSGASSTALA